MCLHHFQQFWVILSLFLYDREISALFYLSHNTRKPVFGVFDQVWFKPVCSAKEASYSHEIANIKTRDIILSRQRIIKVLIRLRGCAGWSAPLLFAYGINKFSHDTAHLILPQRSSPNNDTRSTIPSSSQEDWAPGEELQYI